MKQAPNNRPTSSLHELVRQLGGRTTIVQQTQERLAQQGHTIARSTIHSIIRRGHGAQLVINVLLETIEQEQQAHRLIQDRIAQLTQS